MGMFKKKYLPKHLKSGSPEEKKSNQEPHYVCEKPKEQSLDFKWLDKMIDEEMSRREAHDNVC